MHVHCVRTSVPARPPLTLHVPSWLRRPLISPLKTKAWTHHSDLERLSTPLLAPFPFFFLFTPSLSFHHSQEESDQSLKLSWARGSGILRKPTSLRDMLKSRCDKNTLRGKINAVVGSRHLLCHSCLTSLTKTKKQKKPPTDNQWHWQCFSTDWARHESDLEMRCLFAALRKLGIL